MWGGGRKKERDLMSVYARVCVSTCLYVCVCVYACTHTYKHMWKGVQDVDMWAWSQNTKSLKEQRLPKAVQCT